jgi:hypothetical protein
LEVDDLTSCLTTDKNRILFADFSLFPLLQKKLRLLVRKLCHAQVVDKPVLQTTMALSLFTQKETSVTTSIPQDYKFLLPTPLVKGMVSLYLNEPLFSMPTM